MNSLKKGEGVPLLNFVGGLGTPLLNFEGSPGIPLLNFRRVPGPTFKLWGGVQGPEVLVPLLHHAVASFYPSTCIHSVFKQLMSEFSDVMSTSSSEKFNTSLIGLVVLNVSSLIPLFPNSVISFSNDFQLQLEAPFFCR